MKTKFAQPTAADYARASQALDRYDGDLCQEWAYLAGRFCITVAASWQMNRSASDLDMAFVRVHNARCYLAELGHTTPTA